MIEPHRRKGSGPDGNERNIAAQPLPHRADRPARRALPTISTGGSPTRSRAATSPRSSCRPTAWTKPAFQAFAERDRAARPGQRASRRSSPTTRASPDGSRADGIHVEGGKAAARRRDRPHAGQDDGRRRRRQDPRRRAGARRGAAGLLFFGRFGYDNKPEPHPRNLALGRWWAEMIEIPCIVLGGSDVASVEAVAATGAEFVALSSAVFADGVDPPRRSRAPTRCSTKPRRVSRTEPLSRPVLRSALSSPWLPAVRRRCRRHGA